MKKLILTLLLIISSDIYVNGQCTNQVTHTAGTLNINSVDVTVTSSGHIWELNTYCANSIRPYVAGYNPTILSGNGSYTFDFDPPVTGVTLDFGGTTNIGEHYEEVVLYVNGIHYTFTDVGSQSICDDLSIITPEGNMAACDECLHSGWYGTHINQEISSLTVEDIFFTGSPQGTVFSLYFCDSILGDGDFSTLSTDIAPNPFSSIRNLHFNVPLSNAALHIYNNQGQEVLVFKEISGQDIPLNCSSSNSGLYFLNVVINGQHVQTKTLAIK
ncbi:T9SS type A sorting domain-containing protein [Flavobacterium silvaticum]|uniref:T9SS type A sorting domain-containing protein n=1 Tax=Flavobacterium silvaticum TaxID=1852020 RepID=A0A972G048_9FLAO|nr:T9SS type A sorting domain-containing protein [Flavobacterium silvaticum]NMH27996.1 T9SS type A sorting domain-containing protein [Flavobacterium silvaticum]